MEERVSLAQIIEGSDRWAPLTSSFLPLLRARDPGHVSSSRTPGLRPHKGRKLAPRAAPPHCIVMRPLNHVLFHPRCSLCTFSTGETINTTTASKCHCLERREKMTGILANWSRYGSWWRLNFTSRYLNKKTCVSTKEEATDTNRDSIWRTKI